MSALDAQADSRPAKRRRMNLMCEEPGGSPGFRFAVSSDVEQARPRQTLSKRLSLCSPGKLIALKTRSTTAFIEIEVF